MNKLKQLLKEQHKTQRDLANYLNLHEATVSGYLANRTQMDYDTLINTADFLNVSVDFLLGHKQPIEEYRPPVYENEEEKQLIENFRKCTKTQRERICGYAEALVITKNKKPD